MLCKQPRAPRPGLLVERIRTSSVCSAEAGQIPASTNQSRPNITIGRRYGGKFRQGDGSDSLHETFGDCDLFIGRSNSNYHSSSMPKRAQFGRHGADFPTGGAMADDLMGGRGMDFRFV